MRSDPPMQTPMDAGGEGGAWASKAEAEAQQLRRFFQGEEHRTHPTSPVLPRLAALHDKAAPRSLNQVPFALTAHSDAAGDRSRGGSAVTPRQVVSGPAVPSVSSLNREHDSLSLQLAGMGGGGNGVVVGTSSATTILNPRNEPRHTSAPGVPRLAQSHQRRHSDETPIKLHNSAGSELTRLSEAPPLSRLLRVSTNSFEQPSAVQLLPSVSRTKVRARGTRRRSSSSSPRTPSSSEVQAPVQGNVALLAEPRVSGESAITSSPSQQPSLTPRTARGAEDGDPSPSPLRHRRADRATAEPRTAAEARVLSVANARGRSRDGRITVVVRKRPLAPGESGVDCVQVDGAHVRIAVRKQRVDLTSYKESSDYIFDNAFGAEATNEEVYAHSVKELLTVSLSGGSASCFAYGQTGSGKTYTMIGTDTEKGLYLQAAADLFERLRPGQQLCVSFFEIYCNSLYDLLNRRHPIVLREDANRRVNICGVTWCTVAAVEELWQLVQSGMEQRRTGATTANEHSSRSHAVLSLRIKDSLHPDFTGTINFVDLAGSERAADTAAHGRLTRLEGAEINKSLLALKECIRALDEKKKHVPFRGSRLTEVLRDSFTGNSKTVMIATVSPSSVNHEHTNNTLRYAFRVKGLSIASVEPSRARNAPRIYQLVARSRSSASAAANDPSSTPALPGCGVDKSHAEDAETPRKPRRAPKRRHHYAKVHRSPSEIGTTDANESVITCDTATDTPQPRLRATQRGRPHQVRHNSKMSPIPAARRGISALLPDATKSLSRRRTRRRTSKYGSLLPPASRSIYESTDLFLTAVSGTDAKSGPPAEATVPRVKGAARRPPPFTAVDVEALEQRLRSQIIAQLRLDLGQQLEEVLTEKDAVIAALRSENEKLRQALEKARKDEQWLGGSPHEVDGRQRAGVVLTLPYPSSPSILQEQLSSAVSTASAGEEAPVQVLPE
ncbi:hypothetical protein GH5_01374 [Leishmania sp. Ghana 2012 LV757]|uniref:hypothetical protein n=1 Tax=Leishmania sp. Ghana 2012 LV757 TaxID=2803181 RepID=UPI001B6B51FC|nr:hypothetical protein GH5_01374 [Leishmania sp. Ghana 2012 LV757]